MEEISGTLTLYDISEWKHRCYDVNGLSTHVFLSSCLTAKQHRLLHTSDSTESRTRNAWHNASGAWLLFWNSI